MVVSWRGVTSRGSRGVGAQGEAGWNSNKTDREANVCWRQGRGGNETTPLIGEWNRTYTDPF